MTALTPVDHVALELCPQHVACGGCQHRADVVSRFVDARLAAERTHIHKLMRAWALDAQMTFSQPSRTRALNDVLEDLRRVVGQEGES